jgi:hypothetical protein
VRETSTTSIKSLLMHQMLMEVRETQIEPWQINLRGHQQPEHEQCYLNRAAMHARSYL